MVKIITPIRPYVINRLPSLLLSSVLAVMAVTTPHRKKSTESSTKKGKKTFAKKFFTLVVSEINIVSWGRREACFPKGHPLSAAPFGNQLPSSHHTFISVFFFILPKSFGKIDYSNREGPRANNYRPPYQRPKECGFSTF